MHDDLAILFQQEEAESRDQLATNFSGLFFALPAQTNHRSAVSMPSLARYRQEGLAAINSNGGFQFDRKWTKEQAFDYISQQLPLVTNLLRQRAATDKLKRPSILSCMKERHSIRLSGVALPDGNTIFQYTHRTGRGFRGSILILSRSFIYCVIRLLSR